jgi:sulfite exporter TauE/SafE
VAAAAATMLAFGLGAAVSLAAFAYGSRGALAATRAAWGRWAAAAKPAFGTILTLVGLAILTGVDKRVEAALLDLMPAWLITFTTRF